MPGTSVGMVENWPLWQADHCLTGHAELPREGVAAASPLRHGGHRPAGRFFPRAPLDKAAMEPARVQGERTEAAICGGRQPPRTCRLGELESGLQAEVAECGGESLTQGDWKEPAEAAIMEQAPEQAEVPQSRTCWQVSWRLRSTLGSY